MKDDKLPKRAETKKQGKVPENEELTNKYL